MAYVRISTSVSLSIRAERERERSTGDRATDRPSPQPAVDPPHPLFIELYLASAIVVVTSRRVSTDVRVGGKVSPPSN